MLKPMNYTWKPMTRAEIEKMGTESGKSKCLRVFISTLFRFYLRCNYLLYLSLLCT